MSVNTLLQCYRKEESFVKKVDFTQVNDGRTALGHIRHTMCRTFLQPLQKWRTQCISSFQSILERDRLSANRKPVTQCPSLLYWHMSPCYYSSDAAFLCNETVSIAFHMSAKDVCLYESTANLETTGCTEGPARVKNNDLQTDSYRDNLLTQDISTLASSALGRMSWLTLYFQQESSGTDPHRHSRSWGRDGGKVQGVVTFLGTALPKATAGVEQKSPMFTPGVAKEDLSLATAMSQLATNWHPAAVARPFTMAMMGTGWFWISIMTWGANTPASLPSKSEVAVKACYFMWFYCSEPFSNP